MRAALAGTVAKGGLGTLACPQTVVHPRTLQHFEKWQSPGRGRLCKYAMLARQSLLHRLRRPFAERALIVVFSYRTPCDHQQHNKQHNKQRSLVAEHSTQNRNSSCPQVIKIRYCQSPSTQARSSDRLPRLSAGFADKDYAAQENQKSAQGAKAEA